MAFYIEFIAGDRHSACRNDAWSLIDNRKQGPHVIAIVPAADLVPYSEADIRSAFFKAADNCGLDDAGRLVADAKAWLAEQCAPPPRPA